jgi:hypothetical protein
MILQSGRKLMIIVLGALLLLSVNLAAQGTLTQIINNGPTDKRLNVVIIAEAYTADQEGQFSIDAVNMVDYLFTLSPFDVYSSYFNVFSIFVASAQSGADHPTDWIYRDTYFNSTYDSYGITRALTIPPNNYDPDYSHGAGKVYSLLATHLPDYDMVIIIVNDPQYGGTGGSFAISSIHASAPEIVAHEVGHSFGNLGDEYDTVTPGYSGHESPNTTAQTVRELIRWTDWILPETPVPTPEYGGYSEAVGLFEGACYEPIGWYRPKLHCKMQALGYLFCEVCKEQLVKMIYTFLSPIESYTPQSLNFTLGYFESTILSIETLQPLDYDLTLQWYIDSNPIPGANGTVLSFAGSDFEAGLRDISISVTDPTALVRTDPGNLLTDEVVWTVEIQDFICGDVDENGILNLLDIVFLIDNKFKDGPPPEHLIVADVNSDGSFDLLDIVHLIDFKFKNGLPPDCQQ